MEVAKVQGRGSRKRSLVRAPHAFLSHRTYILFMSHDPPIHFSSQYSFQERPYATAVTMTEDEMPGRAIALQAQPSSASQHETEPEVIDHNDSFINTEFSPSRCTGSGRKMACVLLGSAVLQFPIWGKSLSHSTSQTLPGHNSSISA